MPSKQLLENPNCIYRRSTISYFLHPSILPLIIAIFNTLLMASSSNPSPLNFTYDVFVSYMHADTGNSFTSHLKSAFDKEGFIVAMNDTVEKGEEISDTVLSNISESLVCVVVFSKGYATCGQCLDELVKIWERKEENGGSVLPVFLGVEPTHVRNQTGAFGDGFQRLIESSNQFKEKEETWKSALAKTANLSGWDSTAKSEAEIVDAIVECIKKTLDQLPSRNYSNGFVGIYQVEKVISLLQLQSKTNVQFWGIWGMGGIGKTRISQELLSQISSLFDATCYLENVRQKLESMGLQFLSKELFSQLGIDFKPSLLYSAQRALHKKRVLIILDDVSNSPPLRSFVKNLPYGFGSRIILTCRDKQVLNNYQCEVYKVQELDRCESLKLFKFHAFKGQLCHDLYEALLNGALLYCGGLPLALELLGCHLYDKNFEEWKSELAKLENVPIPDVNAVMKISYEGLDEYNKSIFLDIACVFCGWAETTVKRILHAHCPDSGIRCLIDKALITNSGGILRMHELIQQFGQYMVFFESKEPGKRSRLWRFQDFSHVVARNTGSEKVEVISVDLNEGRRNMCMKQNFFEKMDQLRVFNLHGIQRCGIIDLPEGLSSLPSKLISYLCWDNFPLTSFPRKFSRADHLVELRFYDSRLKQLWSKGAKPHFPLLECMNLRGSKDLIKLPNLSKCLNLKTLDIGCCGALVELPSSVQHLSKLQTLHMDWCDNLVKLPVLPQSIVSLKLNSTNIKELPSWIGSLFQLQTLDLSHCSNLTCLPESLGSLQSLKYLYMIYSGIRNLPSSIGQLDKGLGLVSLDKMALSNTGIESLPASIMHLSCLRELYLRECINLKSLPKLPSSLKVLDAKECTSLRIEADIFGLSLSKINLSRTGVESLPTSIIHLSQLEELVIEECENLKSLPNLPSSLMVLEAEGCTSLRIEGDIFGLSLRKIYLSRTGVESLPASIKYLSQLKDLHLKECKNLKSLPDLPSSLQELDANGCRSLTTVGNILGKHDGRSVNFNMAGCFNLDENSRIIFLAIAHARLNAYASKPLFSNYCAKVCALLPGSEVPDWFKYKAAGSSIEVELPGAMFLGHLSVPSFCVLIDDFSGSLRLTTRCKCEFITEFGKRHFYSSCFFRHIHDIGGKSKHVVIWTEGTGAALSFIQIIQEFGSPGMMCSKVKFEFEAHIDYLTYSTYPSPPKSKCSKIMHCGVHFSRNWEGNMRKRKAKANLTKKRNKSQKIGS